MILRAPLKQTLRRESSTCDLTLLITWFTPVIHLLREFAARSKARLYRCAIPLESKKELSPEIPALRRRTTAAANPHEVSPVLLEEILIIRTVL